VGGCSNQQRDEHRGEQKWCRPFQFQSGVSRAARRSPLRGSVAIAPAHRSGADDDRCCGDGGDGRGVGTLAGVRHRHWGARGAGPCRHPMRVHQRASSKIASPPIHPGAFQEFLEDPKRARPQHFSQQQISAATAASTKLTGVNDVDHCNIHRATRRRHPA
jgi:hypothetical protein